MSGPWEDYKKQDEAGPWADYQKPSKGFVRDAAEAAAEGLPGRFGVNVVRGAAQLPGVPVEAIVGGGNFLRRQLGLPETPLEQTPAKDWGAQGWLDFLERNAGKANLPAPANEIERITDKAGQFVGGSLPFGPSALVPALTATAGSEVGRATDEAGLTGGYGETVGAFAGGFAPGLVRGATTAVPRTLSLDALKRAKDAAYAASEREGAIFTPDFLKRLKSDIEAKFSEHAYTPENEPGLKGFLNALDRAIESGDNITLKGVDKLRKTASNAAGDFTKPSQQALVGHAKKVIDDALENIAPNEVVSGNHTQAVKLIKEARNLNQRMRLGQTIDEAMFQAENNAASSGVGGNLENAMRKKIKDILNSPKRRASFNESEQAMMKKIIDGSWTQNRLRQIGGFAPSKGFLPAALLAHLGLSGFGGGVPAAATIPLTLAYVGGTQGAKALAEQITKRNIARLNANVRLRGTAKPTQQQQFNDMLIELQRRARLLKPGAGSVPGAAYQEHRTRGYPEAPQGYPYITAR